MQPASKSLRELKTIKKIGSGGFSEVFLVQDSNDHHYALKKILKKPFEYNMDYLYRQISIMEELSSIGNQSTKQGLKSLNNQKKRETIQQKSDIFNANINKLYLWEQTNNHINLLLEYCDGGDLRKDMEQYAPSKVYPLQVCKQILVDVIRGLEILHMKGYVHRDIKTENIFVKTVQDSKGRKKKIYKVGDFGISKNFQVEKAKTVLGTKLYMSPEIYDRQQYGFQIDMWAFGVLMCFLLNRSYPFKLNPFEENNQLTVKQICKQANNFSYKNFVEKSKHKKVENCSKEMEDLFKRIFEINPSKRITFLEIRKHPIFLDYFKNDVISKELQQVYAKKFVKKQSNLSAFYRTSFKNNSLEISTPRGKFMDDKKIILHENTKIQFFHENFMEFKKIKGISLVDKAPFCYNLLKYYLSVKQSFMNNVISPEFAARYPQNKMKAFIKSQEFYALKIKFEEQFNNAKSKFEDLHDQCRDYIQQISKKNQYFAESFLDRKKKFSDNKFEGVFKMSYRQSSSLIFKKSAGLCKEYPENREFTYIYLLTAMCHVFNKLFQEKDTFYETFYPFFQETHSDKDFFDFNRLRKWMQCAQNEVLDKIVSNIIQKYLTISSKKSI